MRRRRWAITPAIPVKPSKVIVAGSGTAVMPLVKVNVGLTLGVFAPFAVTRIVSAEMDDKFDWFVKPLVAKLAVAPTVLLRDAERIDGVTRLGVAVKSTV